MKTSLLIIAATTSLTASTTPLHVELDIYSNRAFLNKTYSLKTEGNISTNLPQNINIQSIRYIVPKNCNIQNSTITKPNNQELKNQKDKILFTIKALEAKSTLLKTLSLQDLKDSSKIESLTNLLVQSLTKNSLKIKSLLDEIEEIDKKLQKTTQKLNLLYTCKKDNKNLKIIYPKTGVKYTPFYNISANIPNSSIEIEKKATILYSSGENYDNIDLNIYSYRYNKNIAPQNFRPNYLGQNKKIYKAVSLSMDKASKQTSQTQTSQHQNLPTKSLYKIKAVKLKSDETNLITIDKEQTDATFKTLIDAYGSNRAYLKGEFKTNKNYTPARANYLLNQNPISSRHMQKIQKGLKTELFFGEDEHVVIKKELIKTVDTKSFFGENKISTQNWQYSITNKKPSSSKFEFVARVPVSKDANIKVKTLAQPKFNSQTAKGKTVWNFTLDPSRTKTIIFGYEVSKTDED